MRGIFQREAHILKFVCIAADGVTGIICMFMTHSFDKPIGDDGIYSGDEGQEGIK